MALTLTSATPAQVPAEGGYLVKLVGAFAPGHRHRVYIGDAGSTADPICVSGKSGQGTIVYPLDAMTLYAYSPRLTVGGAYKVYVVDLDASENATLNSAVTAAPPEFSTLVYMLRRQFPVRLKVGPRDLDLEP